MPSFTQRFHEKREAVNQQDDTADRDDGKNNPFGQVKRRGNLKAHKIGKLNAVYDHYPEKSYGYQMDAQGDRPLPTGRQAREDYVHPRVNPAVVGHRSAQKGEPHKHEARQFLRPEQRLV